MVLCCSWVICKVRVGGGVVEGWDYEGGWGQKRDCTYTDFWHSSVGRLKALPVEAWYVCEGK